MSVIVVATVVPVPEHRDEVIAALEAAIPRVHDEPGCELYALHENNDRLVMIEKWASPELLQTHSAGENLATLGAALAGKTVGELDVQVLRPHPAGTDAQGTV